MRQSEKKKFESKTCVSLDAIFGKLAAIENKIDKNTKKIENIEEKLKKMDKSNDIIREMKNDKIKNICRHGFQSYNFQFFC